MTDTAKITTTADVADFDRDCDRRLALIPKGAAQDAEAARLAAQRDVLLTLGPGDELAPYPAGETVLTVVSKGLVRPRLAGPGPKVVAEPPRDAATKQVDITPTAVIADEEVKP